MIERLVIIGVGLIGGSLARALKRAHYCREVVGCSRNAEHLRKAVELGVIDRFETNVAAALSGADMVVVAVPLGVMEGVFQQMAPAVTPQTVVTDVGSAKGSVIKAAEAAFGRVPPMLVPGHPIAGTEQSGVEASFAELFDDRRVILTPTTEASPEATQRVRAMWESAGAIVEEMSVSHHDEVLAATSHLPHLLAYALVDALVSLDESEEIFRFAAGGFRDFTRIASSDPAMWHDICMANRDGILPVLTRFIDDLSGLREAIQRGDSERLKDTFIRAKTARDRFCMGIPDDASTE